MMALARGRFITLEGGEGVGKSTQVRALADRLRATGLTVLETREPGGSAGAEAIRELLLHREADAWTPAAEALLFAAARSDHVSRLIRPALDQGNWVICDRFIDSSRAYQASGPELTDADILALHKVGSGGLMPDRTLLLQLPPKKLAERRAARKLDRPDRFEDRQDDFHEGVSDAFNRFADIEPSRICRVDADGAAERVTDRLVHALADLL